MNYDKRETEYRLTVSAVILRRIRLMDSKYYTHFVLTEFEGSGFGEFSGVVQFTQSKENRQSKLCADDARRMLAQNFAVDINDLHLIQFSQIH